MTALAVFGPDILVADASARIIRRFDATGRQRGLIGDQSKTEASSSPTEAWISAWTRRASSAPPTPAATR